MNIKKYQISGKRKMFVFGVIALVVIVLLLGALSLRGQLGAQGINPKVLTESSVFKQEEQRIIYSFSSDAGILYKAKAEGKDAVTEFIASDPSFDGVKLLPENFSQNSSLTRMVKDSEDPVLKEQNINLNNEHYFYSQKINNIPIYGATLAVHLRNNNEIYNASGNLVTDMATTKEVLSEAQVKQKALDAASQEATPGAKLVVAEANKVIVNKKLMGISPDDGTNYITLAVLVNSESIDSSSYSGPKNYLAFSKLYFVELEKGEVIYVEPKILEALNRIVYGPTGTRYETFTDRVPDAEVNNAFTHAGSIYNFYRNTFGRDSYNSAGGTLIAWTRAEQLGVQCPNAFWDSMRNQAVFCSGMITADIVGHEFTHAYTQYTAGLSVQGQSQAMNESFSDMFGSHLDNNWTMGEGSSIGILRDMSNPPSRGDPDRLFSPAYCPTSFDIHKSAGVTNKTFYLMATGGSFNGCNITGVGRAVAETIMYRAETVYLSASSNFRDFYNAVNSACSDLYGGSASSTCIQVKNATQATELDQQPVGSQTGAACMGIPAQTPQCAGPPFNYTISAGNVSLTQGSSTTNNVNINLASGTAQQVSLLAPSGFPSGANYGFPSLSACYPTCSVPMTIYTDSSTPTGTYTITLNNYPLSVPASFSLTVTSPGSPTPTPASTLPPAAGSYSRVFVTSTQHTGNLGGLTGADSICQTRANAASLGGTWKAWLSSSTTSAASRLVQSAIPYKLLSGTTLANNWADLTDGELASFINVNELGQTLPSSPIQAVWTNTTISGGIKSTTDTCSNWTAASASNATVGFANNASWTDATPSGCTNQIQALYCFEQTTYTPTPAPTATPLPPPSAPPTPTPTPAPTPTPTPTPLVNSCSFNLAEGQTVSGNFDLNISAQRANPSSFISLKVLNSKIGTASALLTAQTDNLNSNLSSSSLFNPGTASLACEILSAPGGSVLFSKPLTLEVFNAPTAPGATPGPCAIASASWTVSEITETNPVGLLVTASGSCSGKQVHFEVIEDVVPEGFFSNLIYSIQSFLGVASTYGPAVQPKDISFIQTGGSWQALGSWVGQRDPTDAAINKFYFRTNIVGENQQIQSAEPKLLVNSQFSAPAPTPGQDPTVATPTPVATALPSSTPGPSGSPAAGFTTQPVTILDVTATNIRSTQADIIWSTSQPGTSQVVYSGAADARNIVTNNLSGASLSTLDPALVTSHKVTITNLTPGRLYFYKVRSANSAGSTDSVVKILRTAP